MWFSCGSHQQPNSKRVCPYTYSSACIGLLYAHWLIVYASTLATPCGAVLLSTPQPQIAWRPRARANQLPYTIPGPRPPWYWLTKTSSQCPLYIYIYMTTILWPLRRDVCRMILKFRLFLTPAERMDDHRLSNRILWCWIWHHYYRIRYRCFCDSSHSFWSDSIDGWLHKFRVPFCCCITLKNQRFVTRPAQKGRKTLSPYQVIVLNMCRTGKSTH